MPTFEEARDAILSQFRTDWEAETPAVNGGTVPVVEWDGVDATTPHSADAAWARITVRHGLVQLATLAPPGSRRFTRRGLVLVQVFTPRGGGLSLGGKLATIARDAFEGRRTANGIWFRNVRINEIGPDGQWNQLNVIAEFEYDELR